MLGEAAWKVMLTPGPLRAFFERVRARRGPQIAATATARKLAVLFWHLLTRERGLRLRPARDDPQQDPPARAARRRPAAEGTQGHRRRQIEGRLRRRARALPPSRNRLSTAGQRLESQRPAKSGCGRDTGARIFKALEGQSRAADSVSPKVCASLRQSPAPTKGSHSSRRHPVHLTFIRRSSRRSTLMPWRRRSATARRRKAIAVVAFSSASTST